MPGLYQGLEFLPSKGDAPPPTPWGRPVTWPVHLCCYGNQAILEVQGPSGSLLRRKSLETLERGESFVWEREMLLELPKSGFLTLLNQGRKVLEINWPVFESRTSKDQSQDLEWVTSALHTVLSSSRRGQQQPTL